MNPMTMSRPGLYDRLTPTDVLDRYKRNYGLGDEIVLANVEKHASLEAELTDILLACAAPKRPEIFASSYARLYTELPWLVGTGSHTLADLERWATLLRPNSTIYEIGSGAGKLIKYLAGKGHACTGTDLASERIGSAKSSSESVSWGTTDGVHLTNFAEPGSFDYVISNHVVEHLHPDDISTHFSEARKLLKPGGQYIIGTPYAPFGPGDLSKVFDWEKPVFMHLHEFTYSELLAIVKDCGYRDLNAIFLMPKVHKVKLSTSYTKYLLFLERMLRDEDGKKTFNNFILKYRTYFLLKKDIWVSLMN